MNIHFIPFAMETYGKLGTKALVERLVAAAGLPALVVAAFTRRVQF